MDVVRAAGNSFPPYHTLHAPSRASRKKTQGFSEEYAESMVWYRTTFILLYEYRPGPPFSRTQFIIQVRTGSLRETRTSFRPPYASRPLSWCYRSRSSQCHRFASDRCAQEHPTRNGFVARCRLATRARSLRDRIRPRPRVREAVRVQF